ncbi:GDP-L-fucose synthase [Paenibacillus sp. GYB004]|uniref:GDP-L-fucose synthase family protein n=1 Tax=Paenibacillus sp. GYB004 TaxID=2994393 RepID=UPI002F96BB5A
MINVSKLEDQNILVTGGSGFLGHHIVKCLEQENPRRIISFSSKQYDLTNEEAVKSLFTDNDIDVVIHAAADVGGIGYNSTHPGQQFYKNIMMNTLVQHYAKLKNVKKFVGIGSVCEYPAEAPVPFKEDDIWNGYPIEDNDAYALSKRMLLAQSIVYRKEYGFNAVHLLPINLYGPRDNFDLASAHVIPALVRKIHTALVHDISEVEVWGTGEETREFLFVEDAARAIVSATKYYNSSQPINIGTGEEVKIKTVADEIKNILGYRGKFVYNTDKPGGHKRRQLDVSRANEAFGFEAKITLREGLKRTIDYWVTTNE